MRCDRPKGATTAAAAAAEAAARVFVFVFGVSSCVIRCLPGRQCLAGVLRGRVARIAIFGGLLFGFFLCSRCVFFYPTFIPLPLCRRCKGCIVLSQGLTSGVSDLFVFPPDFRQ